MKFEEFLNIPPYQLEKQEKRKLLTTRLGELSELHYHNCAAYKKIVDILGFHGEKVKDYEELPFLPVRLFKELELKSVESEDIVKTMTSSGTTGQNVSKIYLDKITSSNQQKALVKIISDFAGNSRLPMIIIDCPSVLKDRIKFSARGAGILGFSIFASDKIYALQDNMELNIEAIKLFLEKHRGKKILLFGFTFIIWKYFYQALLKYQEEIDFSQGILIHGGGWKKLINEAVSEGKFKSCLQETCGLYKIYDYYGMVEQTGCIYMECEYGHLHASIFSDIVIRNSRNFSPCKIGEKGMIQVLSVIPESYPGHSILTEDEGIVLGEDDCPCGRKGKYFKIFGRIKNAEVRGCSDTYEKR